MSNVPFDDAFVKALMDIEGVHGVGTSDDGTALHIYASKTRKVTAFMRYTFPAGIERWVVHRCAPPRPAEEGAAR